MKRKALLMAVLSAALVACSGPEQTYEVRQQVLNEAVYASGQVMPAEYYFLAVNEADKIMQLLVSEGDTVDQGKVLAVLGTASEDRQLDILSRQVALARQQAGSRSAVLAELRTQAQLALERYRQDLRNAHRYEELAVEKAVSAREAEQARLQARSSQATYRSLQQQLAGRSNELRSQVLAAEQQLALLNQSREGKVLASPLRGRVFRIYHQEGALVQPAQPLMLVGAADRFKLELLVDERDIARLKIGQRIYFQTEVHPDKQLEARISKIIPVLQPESRSFAVEAQVLSPGVLYPQSTVEANILIREKVPALLIPADYLLAGDSVRVVAGNKTRKVKIVPGTRNGDKLEVVRGLKPGEVILKSE